MTKQILAKTDEGEFIQYEQSGPYEGDEAPTVDICYTYVAAPKSPSEDDGPPKHDNPNLYHVVLMYLIQIDGEGNIQRNNIILWNSSFFGLPASGVSKLIDGLKIFEQISDRPADFINLPDSWEVIQAKQLDQ